MQGKRLFFVDTAEGVQQCTAHGVASIYEVIPPTAMLRPYFDLEYSKHANPTRTAATDRAVVEHILALVDDFCVVNGLDARVLHAMSVVLDASDGAKFSQHVIVHLSGGAGLASVVQAKAVCRHVVAGMPEALKAVHTEAGIVGCIIDQSVYSRNQQMRIAGCVKLGSDRVLRVLQPQGCTLEDTLICMHQAEVVWPASLLAGPQRHSSTSTKLTAGQGLLHTAAADAISRGMGGCTITGSALHTAFGSDEPSIFVYTTSTTCAHRIHKSNRAYAELDCAAFRWRVLCRDGCQDPGSTSHAAG